MSDFVTEDDILNFFHTINPDFHDITTIPTTIRNASYTEIIQRSGQSWAEATETIYLDGRGDAFLYVPTIPIISLRSVTIISPSLTETALIVSQTDDDRQIWYDDQTGKIEIIQPIAGIEWMEEEYDAGVFPEGTNNVRVIGSFGSTSPASILTMLQLYIMLRHMSRMIPGKYAVGDVISESIGKYKYTLGSFGAKGKRMTIDDTVDFLFSLLPQNSSFVYDSI